MKEQVDPIRVLHDAVYKARQKSKWRGFAVLLLFWLVLCCLVVYFTEKHASLKIPTSKLIQQMKQDYYNIFRRTSF